MTKLGALIAGTSAGARLARLAMALLLTVLVGSSTAPQPARAADPAVVYMSQVGRELMAAARARSPQMMTQVIQKHGDITYIALYALGSYRSKLASADKPDYYNGTARWMGRYATSKVPEYQVARVEWSNESVRGGSGVMVDSTVTLRDGSTYEVRWLLSKVGGTYKVRDAMVMGFWMTPFLQKLFQDYVAENGGSVRALTTVLNR